MKDYSAFTHSKDFQPAVESLDKLNIKSKNTLFIDGNWVEPISGQYTPVLNPATGEHLADVAEANETDVDLAVSAARRAYESDWSNRTGAERGKLLFNLSKLIQEHSHELSLLESVNTGRTITSCLSGDIPRAASEIFYNAGWSDKLDYAFAGRSVRPLGVCGQVVPWNFPLLMAAKKLAPALACGNTVVIKSAETTPLTLLRLAELIDEAGFPPGVVNVITGSGMTGEALVRHPDVDKVTFTGSTAVGKRIQKVIAGTHKRFTLELGGKAAQIVFEDAALDQAVEGIVAGIFFNQGQVCCAGSRLLVQEGIQDEFIEKLKERMSDLTVGNPLDKNMDIGAIHSETQLERVTQLVEEAQSDGSTLWSSAHHIPEKGNWFPPSLLLDCAQNSSAIQKEIFGPVLTVQTFRTAEEAIEKANNTDYGLSAGVWTEKGSKALAVSSKLKSGIVWANCYNVSSSCAPFGGYKQSGIGREGGLQGLSPYVEVAF